MEYIFKMHSRNVCLFFSLCVAMYRSFSYVEPTPGGDFPQLLIFVFILDVQNGCLSRRHTGEGSVNRRHHHIFNYLLSQSTATFLTNVSSFVVEQYFLYSPWVILLNYYSCLWCAYDSPVARWFVVSWILSNDGRKILVKSWLCKELNKHYDMHQTSEHSNKSKWHKSLAL